MTKQERTLFSVLAVALLGACADFEPGSSITTTRVLGAQVSVSGDPERASAVPGEQVDIRWITVSPESEPTLRWVFVACPAMGVGVDCVAEPLATFEGQGAVAELTVSIPDDDTLGPADRVRVLGVICDRGTPGQDGQGTPGCKGKDGHGTPVTLDVQITRDGQLNRNPPLDDARVALDGQALAPETRDVSPGGCRSDDPLEQIAADGKKHDLSLTLSASTRERYRKQDGHDPVLEDLQVSHFSTAGGLERQYSFVEDASGNDPPHITLTWSAPKRADVPADGLIVRFVIVVRDLRGGTSFTERALCATR